MNDQARHRRRRSRLEKLLYSSLRLSKYPLPGVFVALAGCVPLNFVAISPDGRYAVVPFNDEGPALLGKTNGGLVMIDLQTREATLVADEVQSSMWVSIANGTIARVIEKDNRNTIEVKYRGQTWLYSDASFPTLSPDGQTMFYVHNDGSNIHATPEQAVGPIYARTWPNDDDRDMDLTGIPSCVSPDGRHLAYITQQQRDGKPAWGICVVPVGGGASTWLAEFNPDYAWFIQPRWIDNQTLVFRGYAEGSPEDTDLFTVDLNGRVRQLTADNTLSEAYPQPASDGRLVWLAVQGKVLDEDRESPLLGMRGRLMVGTLNDDGTLEVQDTGRQAYSFAVHGDRLLFVDMNEVLGRSDLWMIDLSRPGFRAVNLSDDITREVEGLPEAKDPY